MINKVALITGGSKGIGLAIAKALLAEGHNVAITSRNQSDLDELNHYYKSQYPNQLMGISCDVRSFNNQVDTVHKIIERWGRIDFVIANAGIGVFAPVQEIGVEDWQSVIDINLSGVFYTLKSTFDVLKESQGYFISIASLAGTNFFAKGSVYNASKFGVVGFTQAAMLDLRPHGIKATTIMPGSVATYFNGNIPSEKDSWKIQPEDIGKLVVDLIKMNPRTLPSKIEVRPTRPDLK